ncbi:MAG: hypothetical protein KAX49_04215 [Halanaerobiales bacterium]|nr:hypothetical protein [Halanaerobiales bacterium]
MTIPKNPSLKDWKDGRYKQLDENTYLPTVGHEEGILKMSVTVDSSNE